MNDRAVSERRTNDRSIIDGMLAHVGKGISSSELAYNRALHWARRREIADTWSDLLTSELSSAFSLMGGRKR